MQSMHKLSLEWASAVGLGAQRRTWSPKANIFGFLGPLRLCEYAIEKHGIFAMSRETDEPVPIKSMHRCSRTVNTSAVLPVLSVLVTKSTLITPNHVLR